MNRRDVVKTYRMKLCPFCAVRDPRRRPRIVGAIEVCGIPGGYVVRCGGKYCNAFGTARPTKGEAVADWNMRGGRR